MRYEGYNGQITVEGDDLILSWEGTVAKAAFGSGPAESIPLEPVSGVTIKDATRSRNGSLQLHLDDDPVPTLTAATAASNAETVLFRFKDQERFRELYDWLRHVRT